LAQLRQGVFEYENLWFRSSGAIGFFYPFIKKTANFYKLLMLLVAIFLIIEDSEKNVDSFTKKGKSKMAVNNNQQALTRERVKKEKKQEHSETRAKVRIRVRLIPIWLRVIIVIGLVAISIVAGATFGYSMMGDGNPLDIFEKSTWMHVVDLIDKE
jgi:predicted DNA repair protein MutK